MPIQSTSEPELPVEGQVPTSSSDQTERFDRQNVQAHGEYAEQAQRQQQKPMKQQSHLQTPELAGSVSPPTPRFVGDLNPEARLLEEPSPPEYAEDTGPENVGLWIQPGSNKQNECSSTAPGPSRRQPGSKVSTRSDLLSDTTIRELSKIYFSNVHPIIPLLHEEEYWQSFPQCTVSIPLVHAVCLIAAKDSAAEKHLRLLPSKEIIIPVRRFCSQLYQSISTAIACHRGMWKITRMRILGLLSLHQEGSDGAEKASSHISQAIHHAQSLALHLPQPSDPGWHMKRAFWCLWTLDRLNSAINSRPCFIADIDIATSDLAPQESGFIAFNLCFRLAKILNKVIGLYRPNSERTLSGWDSGFPGFEQIMDEANAWKLPPSTIGSSPDITLVNIAGEWAYICSETNELWL